MQHKKLRITTMTAGLLLAGGLLVSSGVQAGEPSAAALADTCAGCHGTDGVSAGPSMPTIAGMPAGYLKELMRAFKSGERPSTIMGRLTQGYSEAEIDQISDVYAAKSWGNAVINPNLKEGTTVDAAQAATGKKAAKRCGKCHEDGGRSTEDDTPRLAGQWVDYLIFKMEDYKNPDMTVPQPKKMKKQIDKLSAEQLKAIAHFYASQQ